ncbi:MAG: NTP transferase domain-containing protein [Syntrophomonadaceae bacterium]|jgi:mannose-1-phosphate guanylyltransferase/mannose-6-phosphate isomerase|nr:NTP transferase domain-containing protein [Syntrophomonadaceae bacterium]
MIAAILAGGRGVRLWPESRNQHPKQLCKLVGNKSMLDHTIDRLKQADCHKIVIITSDDLLDSINQLVNKREDRDQIQVMSEPEGKNTAPAVGMVLAQYAQLKDEVLGIFPADHHILNEHVFNDSLKKASLAADKGHIVTIGVQPNRPETGYGYIEKTKWEIGQIGGVYQVKSFYEKPDTERAQAYVETGRFMWNAGIYIGKIGVLFEEFRKHLPEIYAVARKGYDTYKQSYAKLPNISLDHGIAEKSDRMAVVPADMGWCDLGSWNALSEIRPADEQENVCEGHDIIAMDSRRCIVKQGEKTIVLFGVQDLVVVETDDVIMVADRNKCQNIRSLTESLKSMGREDLL